MSQCSPDIESDALDRAAFQLFKLDNPASRWPSVNQEQYRREAKSILDAARSTDEAATPQRCDLLDALDWLESSANIKVGGFIPPEVKQHNQTAASHAEKLRLFLFGVAAQGWRDISTAPKDGTVCDLWIKGATAGRICDLWWCGDGTWCGHDASIFSHWMPAPVSGPSLTSTDREASK